MKPLNLFVELIRRVIPHNIHLSNKDYAPHHHRNGNNGKIYTCKVKAVDMDVLPPQDIAPQKPGKRGTKSGAECTVIHS